MVETEMTEERLQRRFALLNQQIENENRKIRNISGYWQPDQIEKAKKQRFKYQQMRSNLKDSWPELLL